MTDGRYTPAVPAPDDRLQVCDSLDLMLCEDGPGDAIAAMTSVSETLAFADLDRSAPAPRCSDAI